MLMAVRLCQCWPADLCGRLSSSLKITGAARFSAASRNGWHGCISRFQWNFVSKESRAYSVLHLKDAAYFSLQGAAVLGFFNGHIIKSITLAAWCQLREDRRHTALVYYWITPLCQGGDSDCGICARFAGCAGCRLHAVFLMCCTLGDLPLEKYSWNISCLHVNCSVL